MTDEDEDNTIPFWELRVTSGGSINVPLIGAVRVAGMDVSVVEAVIREASLHRDVFRNPIVTVTVKQRRTNHIMVAGAVADPGTIELPAATSNLATALASAGGLADRAAGIVEIRNPGHAQASAPEGRWVNYEERQEPHVSPPPLDVNLVSATHDGAGNHYLDDGAFVFVREQSERFVHVMGLIGNKKIPLPPNRDVRLLDALAQAGGPRYSLWIAKRVNVIRRIPSSDQTATIKLSISKAKRDGTENILLASGDVVSVEENLLTFTLSTIQGIVGVGVSAAQGAATLP